MTGPRLRIAAFDDLDTRTAYRLWSLREAVFVVEQACPYPELDGRDLEAGTRHVWLEADGEPVAYLRLLEEPDGAVRVGRVLVRRDRRGRGLAGTLLRAALEVAGHRESRLDAQSHLAGWYARFGYARSGAEFVEDGIPHVPMRRPSPP